MTRCWKRNAVVLTVAIVVCAATYLLTLGHFFLPLTATGHYENEKLDTWDYTTYPLAIQPKPTGLADVLKRAAWKLARPGQACLVATAERLKAAAPDQEHSLQEVLETMGYKFPQGCHATTVEIVPRWRITHYPSMLKRIAKDLHFRVTGRASADPGVDEKPNHPAAGKAGISPLFAVQHHPPGLPEPGRSR